MTSPELVKLCSFLHEAWVPKPGWPQSALPVLVLPPGGKGVEAPIIWSFFCTTAQNGHGEPSLRPTGSLPIRSHPRGDLTGRKEVLGALEVANPGQLGLSTPKQVREGICRTLSAASRAPSSPFRCHLSGCCCCNGDDPDEILTCVINVAGALMMQERRAMYDVLAQS